MKLLNRNTRRRKPVTRTDAQGGRSAAKKRKRIDAHKRKLLFAMLIAAVGFLLIIVKLFDVSIIKSSYWTGRAMNQWTRVTS